MDFKFIKLQFEERKPKDIDGLFNYPYSQEILIEINGNMFRGVFHPELDTICAVYPPYIELTNFSTLSKEQCLTFNIYESKFLITVINNNICTDIFHFNYLSQAILRFNNLFHDFTKSYESYGDSTFSYSKQESLTDINYPSPRAFYFNDFYKLHYFCDLNGDFESSIILSNKSVKMIKMTTENPFTKQNDERMIYEKIEDN